jgi:vitamin B12 transporter
MHYSNKWFALGTTAIFKNRKPQQASSIKVVIDENCFMMNGEAEFFILKNRLSSFVELDDIFNETCRDLLGSQKPGRWVMGGIKLNFSK